MPFVVGFFLGRWVTMLVVFMFCHPIRFLIGLVRFALTTAALVVGILGPLVMASSGWAWMVMCILAGLVLLYISRILRNFADGL